MDGDLCLFLGQSVAQEQTVGLCGFVHNDNDEASDRSKEKMELGIKHTFMHSGELRAPTALLNNATAAIRYSPPIMS